MSNDLIAALDVGKTHARLSLIDPRSGEEFWSARRVNETQNTSLGRQLDIAGVERWLIDTLRSAPARDCIGAIVPIAHGAAAVLIDDDAKILAAPDYEDPRFETVNESYDPERDPFDRTYSPYLPLGLNLGRQLFYLERCEPSVFAQTAQILTYPQFWAWRLSGVAASEVTSLGCHSDLWLPHSQAFSQLAIRHGWDSLFPARRFAGEGLGPARGPIAESAQLPRDCRIICGIHDSNASYLRYLLGRRKDRFAVLSSGTWTVVMANGVELSRLRAECDMLANVDAFGSPVATARFMGGREYEAIARTTELPTLDALKTVTDKHAMALPAFAVGGPFSTLQGRLINAEELNATERAALATVYVALMSELVIEMLDTDGDIIIDGPLATNPLFAGILGSFRGRSTILVDDGRCATTAILYLAGVAQKTASPLKIVPATELDFLKPYRSAWREHVQNFQDFGNN